MGLSSQTEAAIYYWEGPPSAAEFASAPNKHSSRRAKVQRHGEKKSALIEKESKPQGPLIISISIAQQKLRIYDANGLFAESPISSGMPGHPTPMGVFSVIQKQKFHRSNIYSGAPMPFMQRITWSGVAMHAGVLPGHPASHGCIRLPTAFAVKMYGWTRMGARVIVTPGGIAPENFSHPLLASVKVVPQPAAAEETKADSAPIQAPQKVEAQTAATDGRIELRRTVGHADDVKAASDVASNVKTADASGALPTALSTSETPDAALAGENSPARADAVASDKADSGGQDASRVVAQRDNGPETLTAKVADSGTKPAASTLPVKTETAVAEAAKPSKNSTEAPAPAEAAKAATEPPAAPAATNEAPLKEDLKSDFVKTYLGPPIKKTEQIAVFVSRKDSKLYVRQNFAPLFNVPVTIKTDERPLGTHIFTAQIDKNDANVVHWSVVSLPVPAKAASRSAQEVRISRGRKMSPAPIETKSVPAPDSAAEALDRLTLPAEVMAKIYEAVSTGGSIIVSDQGIAAGETGEGTDFIVSLR